MPAQVEQTPIVAEFFSGGRAPFGYERRLDGRLVIVEDEAETIRFAFNEYLRLGSLRETHKRLCARGAATRRGRPFCRESMQFMLKNPMYAGQLRRGLTVYEASHPAIVERETFEKVRELLSKNTSRPDPVPAERQEPRPRARTIVVEAQEPPAPPAKLPLKRVPLLLALEAWRVSRSPAPSTVESYRWLLERLAKAGVKNTDDVTPERVGSFLSKHGARTSPGTANLHLAALCSVLTFLSRLDRFPIQKLQRIRWLKLKVRRRVELSARFLTRDEVERIVAAAKKDSVRLMIRAAVLSGLRASELCRLRWEDVSLTDRPTLHVREDLSLGQVGRIKTGHERLVPVCAELAELLRAHAKPSGFVFRAGPRARRNAHMTIKGLRQQLQAAARRAGVPGVTFHVTRHTRASWWVQAGVSIVKVAAWLGHTVEVCTMHYAGLMKGYDPDAERT